MATIETHIGELEAAAVVYQAMVDGFTSALNLPNLSDEEKNELSEDLADAQDRMIKVSNALDADLALKGDGYPDKLNLVASQAVLDALADRIKKLQDAFGEIQPEPVVLADNLGVSVS